MGTENIPCPAAGSRTLTLYCFGAVSPGWCCGLPWWLFYPCCGSAPWRRCCAGCSVWECRVWKRSSASHGRHSWRASGSSRGPATKHPSGNTTSAFPPCPSNRQTQQGRACLVLLLTVQNMGFSPPPTHDRAPQGGKADTYSCHHAVLGNKGHAQEWEELCFQLRNPEHKDIC